MTLESVADRLYQDALAEWERNGRQGPAPRRMTHQGVNQLEQRALKKARGILQARGFNLSDWVE